MPLPEKFTPRRQPVSEAERTAREQARKAAADQARANDPKRGFYRTKEWHRTRAREKRRHYRCADCGYDPKTDRQPEAEKRRMHLAHRSTAWRFMADLKASFAAFLQGPFDWKCDSCHSVETVKRDGGFGVKQPPIRREVY